MKIRDITGFSDYITKNDLANMFNVYTKEVDGVQYHTYNINRGITITGVENIPAQYLEYYTVEHRDNLNLISFKKYGTIELWWLIAKINSISDVTATLTPGRKLIIIGKDSVNKILNSLRA